MIRSSIGESKPLSLRSRPSLAYVLRTSTPGFQTRQHGGLDYFEHQLIPAGHRAEESAEFEVLGQLRGIRRTRGVRPEIPVFVHQKDFHRPLRPL
jgi:hypothetical protein